MSDHSKTSPTLGPVTYDAFRNAALVYLPALGTLYFTISQIVGLPYAEEVVGIIAAVSVFLGVTVKVSKSNYKRSEKGIDGEVLVTPSEDGDSLKLVLENDLESVKDKGTMVFKVTNTGASQ